MYEKLLSSIYYNTKNPSSFSSIKKLFQEARLKNPEITVDQVKQWLSEQLTYTLHKPKRTKFSRNKIIVSYVDEQWEADLVDMREFSRKNDGNNYILTVIDCFSKYAFVRIIKTKTGENITNAFKNIFNERQCHNLRTDRGKEFINETFSKFLKENEINFFTSNDQSIKCAIVERFNRTLKSKMFKYFSAKGTRRYIEVLQDFVKSYNNSYHRTIKMKPIQVNIENQNKVFQNIYKCDNLRILLQQNAKEPNIKTGDKVRLQYATKPFDKGYYPNWTDEIFTIEKSVKGDKQIVFRIKDYSGKLITQKFYPEELQKITENLHRIEKVIKSRNLKGIREVFVKWLNYPSTYNSWIPKSDLQNLY